MRCHWARNVDAVSHTIFQMVAAILSKWADYITSSPWSCMLSLGIKVLFTLLVLGPISKYCLHTLGSGLQIVYTTLEGNPGNVYTLGSKTTHCLSSSAVSKQLTHTHYSQSEKLHHCTLSDLLQGWSPMWIPMAYSRFRVLVLIAHCTVWSLMWF